MKTKAFIFDIGNVLVRFDYGKLRRSLESLGGQTADLAQLEKLSKGYERGGIGRSDFLAQLSTVFSHPAPEAEIARAWQDIFEANYPMWEAVEKLQSQYPLYLLSNTNCLHHEFIEAEYSVLQKFTDGVFSYRAKLLKPEPEIFLLAIRQFGVRPEETFYIDDMAANVTAGLTCGLRAYQYDPDAHEDFLLTLRGSGVHCV